MPTNIQRLRVAIEEWLIRNDLDLDTSFYEMAAWLARGEDYLNDAELVLVFEGGLHTMLNFGGDTEEFEDYIESFGYYFEQGHSWNMGFYPIPDYDFSPARGTYSQKLQDPRWKAKSERVKSNANWTCQDCGASPPPKLETHHCYYTNMRDGNEPWEYPLSALRCLCPACHTARAKSESRMRAYLARLTNSQINELKAGLDSAFYWFREDAVIQFLSRLRNKDEDVLSAVQELLNHRSDDA